MGVELGRISGPLLATNLVRHGIDLSFETDLLFLYVSDNDPANFKVGIKTDTPGRLLDVANKLTSVNFIVDNTLTVPNFDIHTNEIQNLTGPIYISPTGQTLDGILDGGLSGTLSFVGEEDGGSGGTLVFNPIINAGNSSPYGSAPKIHAPALTTDNLKITDQLIKNLINGSDIELSPSGSGIVRFNSYEVNINGSLHATGDITWDGSITFGYDNTDNVNLSSDITSSIIPDVTNTYDLGSTLKRWQDLYSDEIIATSLSTDTLTINNINLLLTPGKTIYVSKNGSDTNYGNHAHSTFATLKQALTSAVSGDTVVIFPGTYEEIFPLTVPAGVGIRGSGIRATTIKPTLATNNKDAFLISGDTMLEFFTISDFYFDSVNNTGYAFRFANGFKTTSRSPYFHNITVKTQGSVTSPTDLRGFASGDAGAGGYFDGSVADPTSLIPTALFFSVTFITPNADALTLTNGVRCEWLNSFSYFARTGIYLTQGTMPSGSLNFSSNNYLSLSAAQTIGTQAFTFECFFYTASNGLQTILGASATGGMSVWLLGDGVNPVTTIQIDRSYVDAAQYTVSAIAINTWHHIAVTRDSSNNMSVFLDGVKATGSASNTANYTGPSGLIGAVAGSAYFFTGYLTQIKLAVGSNYYDPTAASISVPTAVLTTSTNTKLLLTAATSGAYLTDTSGTQTISNISAITYNTSTPFVVKAGAELRSINSANVYGTYGVIADGPDTLAYLIGHNFGYIGTDGDYTNDPTLAIQANEVRQLNNGVVYYETTDHLGDIRVGDIFYVSQETGRIAFDAQSINLGAGGNITIEGPTSTTIINELAYQTGNIKIYDNTISSLVGPVNFLANAGANTTYINTNVEINGSLGVSLDLTADSNVYFGSDSLDTITINAYLTQDINPIAPNSLYLGSNSFRWSRLNSNILDVNGVTKITSNEISTLSGNTDLKLQANGIGRIRAATNNVQIDNNLDIINTLTINRATSLKNTEIGTVLDTSVLTLTGNLNQTGSTYITGTFGNNNIRIVGDSYFQVPDIRLYNNVISNQLLNQDLIFTASGPGAVRVEKLDFVDNIISNAWLGATTESQRSVILSPNGSGNTVINSTKSLKLPVGANTNRTMIAPAGIRYNSSYNRYEGYQPTGLVSFTNMYSYDTTSARYITSLSKTTLGITTVSINVGEYTIQVSSTAGLSVGFKVVSGPSVIPGAGISSIDGNIITLDLPTTNSIAGVIVFGPVILNFALISGLQVGQAVSGTNIQVGTTVVSWNSTSITMSLPISGNVLIGSSITFGPVNSTYITPELTPGASDNTLRFGINGVVKATLSSTAFVTNTWNVGNINISSNNIGPLTSADLYIAPSSGITNIDDVSIQDNEVTNNLDSEFLIQSTGQGYVKFASKGAVVIPIGNDSERRLAPVIGETRYNTDQSYLEVYNGEGWFPAIGTSGAASEEEIVEITNLWSLVLG
jgi:hypothetical protein